MLLLFSASGLHCVQDFVTNPARPPGSTTPVGPTITVTPASATLLAPGSGLRLTGVYRDKDGNEDPGQTLRWASLNPSVATVDAVSGAVAASASGQVAIEATANGVTGYALLTVSARATAPVGPFGAGAHAPTDQPVNALWGSSARDVWAVGNLGAVAHLTAAGAAYASITTADLLGVWGPDTDRVFTVGERGTILRHAAGAWASLASGTTATLYGVWGASPHDVFAVGEGGVVLHYDAAVTPDSFSVVPDVPFVPTLRAVWGTAAADVFAVGEGGTILRYDGAAWATMASGVGEILLAVWGTGPGDVYAVGAGGIIVHYDGASWSVVPSGVTEALYGVWGTGPGDVYVAGARGTVRHYNGRAWEPVPAATPGAARGIWGTSAGDIHLVGDSGAVLTATRGAGARLVFAGVPYGAVAGAPFATEVWFVDARGSIDTAATGAVTLALGSNPATDTLGGATTVAAVAGVARFDSLVLRKAAAGYTLVATTTGFGAESPSFKIVPGPPGRLLIHDAPAAATAGVWFDAVRVAVQDASGNPVHNVGTVTMSSVPGSLACGVQGKRTADAATGVAEFDSLRITSICAGSPSYRLVATVPGLPADTSAPFAVSPGVATTVIVDPTELAIVAGGTATRALFVADTFSNVITAPATTWASLNAAVATVDPASGLIAGVGAGQAAISAQVGPAVGYTMVTVSLPGLAPVTQWAVQTSGTTATLRGVWGTSAGHVIAVGDGGTVLVYGGTRWVSGGPGGPVQLTGVWGWSAALSDVWVSATEASDSGVVYRYNGSSWRPAPYGGDPTKKYYRTERLGVTGVSPVEAYAVGAHHAIGGVDEDGSGVWHWNLNRWVGTGSYVDAFSGRAIAPGVMYSAGLDGVSRIELGTGLTTQVLAAPYQFGIWGTSSGDLHTVGQDVRGNARAFHFDGAVWSELLLPSGIHFLRAVSGSSTTDAYAVGDSGAVLHYDGAAWTTVATGIPGLTAVTLNAVWVAPTGEVFIVGDNGTIVMGTR